MGLARSIICQRTKHYIKNINIIALFIIKENLASRQRTDFVMHDAEKLTWLCDGTVILIIHVNSCLLFTWLKTN